MGNKNRVGQLVVPEQENHAPALIGQAKEMGIALGGVKVITTLDAETEEGRELSYSMARGDATPIDQYLNVEIEVNNWLITPVEMVNDESGETVTRPLTVMELTDGSRVKTTSPIVAKDLLGYLAIVMRGKWTRPIKFTPRKVNHKPPRFYYTLESKAQFMNVTTKQRQPRTPKVDAPPVS